MTRTIQLKAPAMTDLSRALAESISACLSSRTQRVIVCLPADQFKVKRVHRSAPSSPFPLLASSPMCPSMPFRHLLTCPLATLCLTPSCIRVAFMSP